MIDPAARVLQLAEEILESDAFDANASFFELGGDSLAAVQFVRLIEDELGVEVSLVDFFEAPNLDTFSKVVTAPGTAAG